MARSFFRRCLLSFAALCFVGAACAGVGFAEVPPPVLMQMIRDDAVHRELDLSDDQIDAVMAVLDEVDGPWFRVRIRPEDEQVRVIDGLQESVRQKLASILQPRQLNRMQQLERQALGTRMFVRDDVAKLLKITPTQQSKMQAVFDETDAKSSELNQKVVKLEMQADEAAKQTAGLKDRERKRIVAMLEPSQMQRLGEATGEAFDFSKVLRTYPRAPELVAKGTTWVQGSPVQLSDLRGKVVAVHFYAFQCINCKRNLPHYNGWFKDYADDGLVVIGIQTPETSAERDAQRVTEALADGGQQYSVMLDSDSENWKAYSNTMWPTVYLIDKKGFLRRWWQGELNWQGATGEQQLRQNIEQLLAEEG